MTIASTPVSARLSTLLLCSLARPSSPLIDRVLAAFKLEPTSRRVVARALLAELCRSGKPTTDTLRCWSAMGGLLLRCAMSCTELERQEYYSRLARTTHDIWEAALADAAGGERMGRRSRVIDAVCTEVRQ